MTDARTHLAGWSVNPPGPDLFMAMTGRELALCPECGELTDCKPGCPCTQCWPEDPFAGIPTPADEPF